MTSLGARLAQRERPNTRPAMYHSWRALTFLHWEVPREILQRLLPSGLKVDTHEDKAYVGLVPFTMQGIRRSWLPPVPGISASHETNVRTYVVDEHGVPGVWFFSLDATSSAFVRIARAWYRLPYFRADMSVEKDGCSVEYRSRRKWPPPVPAESCVEVSVSSEALSVSPGSLEFFLVERYVLFSHSGGRLYTGRVWHEPYPLQRAVCRACDETVVCAAGINRPDVAPIVHYSPGVDVEVFALER